MPKRLVIGVVVGFAALTAVASPAGAASSSSKADAALDRALAAFVAAADGPPGIAVVVQRGGTPVLHEAGTAVVDTETPIQLSDHTRVASVAKAFSGAVALSLVASAELSLDETVGEVVPGQPAAWSAVTLRQLLQHTSGIPDFSKSKSFQEALVASLQEPPPPAQLLSYVSDQPLSFAPGSRYKYSNSDNIIVGLMVEAKTGRPYADMLQERVAVPLGLSATSLPSDSALPTPFVHGYDIAADDGPEDVSTVIAAGWTWASGGIVSTPADASTFARGYAAGETTDTPTRAAQRDWVKGSSEPPGPGSMSAGLAIFRYRTRCGTVYGHTGNTLGYTAFIAATGDGGRSVAVTVNAQITPTNNAERFPGLRRIFELGVCAALA
jgi:D-alanyl-D-alanine carboxypeptidase